MPPPGPEKLILSGEAYDGGRVFLSDVSGAAGPRVSAPLEVPAFGILTLFGRKWGRFYFSPS